MYLLSRIRFLNNYFQTLSKASFPVSFLSKTYSCRNIQNSSSSSKEALNCSNEWKMRSNIFLYSIALFSKYYSFYRWSLMSYQVSYLP